MDAASFFLEMDAIALLRPAPLFDRVGFSMIWSDGYADSGDTNKKGSSLMEIPVK